MRRLLFVNPPVGRYDEAEIAPPLSLLTLAAGGAERGHAVQVLDLNLPEHRARADHDSFYEYAIEQISTEEPSDVFVTSMGVNTHVAIKLASAVTKELGIPADIGGIHASSVAPQLRRYLHANVTIADRFAPLPFSAQPLSPRSAVAAIANLVNRESYFSANPRRLVNLESGRGCKYRCGFCYSPTVHSKWATYEVDEVVAAFEDLDRLGFEHAFLVDDNLVNSRSWFVELCKALSRQCSLTWNGYATLLDLTPELIELAAAAGCTNLYLGIDAVDPAQQHEWNKAFYKDAARLQRLLDAAARTASLQLTCAFILDLTSTADASTELTLQVAAHAAFLGADIRLSVLTPYANTPIAASNLDLTYSSARPAILFDLPSIAVTNELGIRAPRLFPWHARPLSIASDDWQLRLLAVHAAQVLLESYDSLNAGLCETSQIWQHCLAIAAEEERCARIHKTELKSLVRSIHASLAA
jgi:hypothetical protein